MDSERNQGDSNGEPGESPSHEESPSGSAPSQESASNGKQSRSSTPGKKGRFRSGVRMSRLMSYTGIRKRKVEAEGAGFGRVVVLNEPGRMFPEGEEPPSDAHHRKYTNNAISTTKYTALTFFPKALFEQFRRAANLYFLLAAIIGLTPLSPYNAASLIAPLILVVSVSMIKEAVEDWKRLSADKEVNQRPVLVYNKDADAFEEKEWQHVQVGEIVKVLKDEFFPADLLFLSSVYPDGVCYVETMNLDGETNLKLRKALERTCEFDTDEAVGEQFTGGCIRCEDPNASLYTFVGNLEWKGQTLALDAQQVLLRDSKLRNTAYVYGVAIFTGHDTKVMQNSSQPPSKRSAIERRMDKVVFLLFGLMLLMAVVGSIAFGIILANDSPSWFYLQTVNSGDAAYEATQPAFAAFLQALTALVLYGYLIPISLYVSIEIVKIFQAWFISADLEMYHEESDRPARARTSNLNEELGQVDTILSDKTGTLTCNQMEFLKCSVAGTSYGRGITEVERATAKRLGIPLSQLDDYDPDEAAEEEGGSSRSKKNKVKGFALKEPRLMEGHWMLEPNAAEIQMFLRHLALCHTVIPEEDDATGEVAYEAESPDEAALVEAARQLGFSFYNRSQTAVRLREPDWAPGAVSSAADLANVSMVERQYEVLHVIEFNSTRKRMSVVVRFPDGKVFLLTKGADSIIYPRLGMAGRQYSEATQAHLNRYGEAGLRTLALAYRELGAAEFEEWEREFTAARTSLDVDREARLDAAAELIENGLTLVGATAVEDKLQAGVPQTIDRLAQAGIKIWVLTGDKMETAINIGFACSLLRDDMTQIVITLDRPEIRKLEDAGDKEKITQASRESVARQLADGADKLETMLTGRGPKPKKKSRAGGKAGGGGGSIEEKRLTEAREDEEEDEDEEEEDDEAAAVFALVIDGKSLTYALEKEQEPRLLALAMQCVSVICCRVSPRQKALVTRLVKDGTGKTTLGIGDGANDVGMIHEADIGVGISGVEGQQAVMASDFAIAQFRFLERLLLVHGHWCYKRIACMVTYFFFKNLTYGMTIFFYNGYAMFSGQVMYNSWAAASFNVFFTSLPVIAYGCLEQDVPAKSCTMFPALYQQGPRNEFFKWPTILRWMLNALYMAVSLFWFALAALSPQATAPGGMLLEMPGMGAALMTGVVVAVNLQMLLMTEFFTWISHLFLWGSIAVWFIFLIIISYLPAWFSTNYFYIFSEVLAPSASFWLTGAVLLPAVGILPYLIYKGVQTQFAPPDHQLVNELVKMGRDEEAALDAVAPVKAPVGFSAAVEAVSKRLAKLERKRRRKERKRKGSGRT